MASSRTGTVTFLGVECDNCGQCGIVGTRWKCALCFDYDLCTSCYLGGKHNLNHKFLRVDVPGGTAQLVASREQSGGVQVGSIQDSGVAFHGVSCDGCKKRNIDGARWKCDQCCDYDLCSSCYVANTHDLDHPFVRFETPNTQGMKISPRQQTANADDGGGQQAVRFLGIHCDGCGEHDIAGTRWKCAFCFDYDLCSSCYEGGEHDLDHIFLRVDSPSGTAVRVPPRKGYGRVTLEALRDGGASFPGIECDVCGKRGIVGPRWKCTACNDYNLCTACYVANCHDFDHIFLRYDSFGRKGLDVSPGLEPSRAGDSETSQEVLFHGITCDSCEKSDIAGARWKCDSCYDYDLCTTCYMAGAHNLHHRFLRFDVPGQRGKEVLPRIKSALFGEVIDDVEATNGEQRAVMFNGVNCDGCDQVGIVGTRWKCAVCIDYDLCSACYTADEHDLNHVFLRFDGPRSAGAHVLPRETSKNACTGATSVDGAGKLPDSPDGDHGGEKDMAAKLRELEDAVQCAICMEGRRTVAFLCGHSACAHCAKNLRICHMCRKSITKKITLY